MSRLKRTWPPLVAGGASILAFFLLLAGLSTRPAPPASPPAVDSTQAPVQALPEPAYDEFRWGDNLASLLKRHAIPDEQAAEASLALSGVTDLRSIPVHTRAAVYSADSGLVRLRLTPPRSPGAFQVERQGGGFIARAVPLPEDTLLRRFEGEIENSFYESFIASGGTAELAVKYIEVFQFVLYFSSETRQGDRYRLIAEEIWRDGERIGYGHILAAQYIQNSDTLTAVWRPDSTDEFGGEYFDAEGISFRRDLLRAPFSAARVTSTFGLRKHPIFGTWKKHYGVDFGAPMGTPVVAAGSGVVTKAVRGDKGLGNWLHIKHDATGFETRYGHLKRFARGIYRGARVKQGQVIGYVGMTGLATAPHLHYETFRDGRRMNPMLVRGSPIQKLTEAERAAFLHDRYEPWRVRMERRGYLALEEGYQGPLPWPEEP